MVSRVVLGVAMLAASLTGGLNASAETLKPDRPDAGPPPLLDTSLPRDTSAGDSAPGTPAPRALDSARTPMPDRDALPHDLQDARLAPPTPPAPQASSTKTGGGPARVKEIFRSQGGSGGTATRDSSAKQTPEDPLSPTSH
jgi:hypothetical protein